MPATIRPRRSVLFMPGANARALAKSRELPADGLIFDLEDAVAPDAKEAARGAVAAALGEGGYGGRELVLRVNPFDSAWGEADLAAVAAMPIDAVLLPKVESAARAAEATFRLPERIAVWCMIETPLGILNAREIAAAPRVAALVMGTSDLTADLHAQVTRARAPLIPALGFALLAARAYGLAALDGVHLDLADDAGFVAQCRQGRSMGFDGKTLIHPKQIATANETFAPSEEEIAVARKIIAAHRDAMAAGKGIVVVDGRLVENLHVAAAERTLALAEATTTIPAVRLDPQTGERG